MARRKNVPSFSIPDEALKIFTELAKSEDKSFAQALRDAMAEYCEKRGKTVNFNVGTWGGYRERSGDSEE